MPNNAKKNVYKEKEFETYVLWRSMPAYFRGMKKQQLNSYGFSDPLILKIASIKNQTAFAKNFKIKDLGTLTDWNKKIKKNKLDVKISNIIFQKQATNVNKVMSAEPNKLLEKIIYEQRQLISSLKKENNYFKKKLHISEVQKNKKEPTIFDEVKNVIMKWRKK